jgi:argininosuccinate lyase
MSERDRGRLADARRRLNVSPLGSGALAGAGYPLDREATAAELRFDGVTANSLDAVGDRDFVVEVLAATTLGMVHLSRLAEEIVWWSNPRFGFVRVAEAYSTGSSMMPNKRNPDPAELVRGRSARVIGALTAMLGILKGLPLGYQRDLQEDKQPLFGAIGIWEGSLRILAGLVATLVIDRERMAAAAAEGYTTATTLADRLVAAGVPFRTAHHVAGALVAQAEAAGIPQLADVPAAALVALLAATDDPAARDLAGRPDRVAAVLAGATVDGALAAADVIGGTAPRRVAAAIAAARERLSLAGVGQDVAARRETPPRPGGPEGPG